MADGRLAPMQADLKRQWRMVDGWMQWWMERSGKEGKVGLGT